MYIKKRKSKYTFVPYVHPTQKPQKAHRSCNCLSTVVECSPQSLHKQNSPKGDRGTRHAFVIYGPTYIFTHTLAVYQEHPLHNTAVFQAEAVASPVQSNQSPTNLHVPEKKLLLVLEALCCGLLLVGAVDHFCCCLCTHSSFKRGARRLGEATKYAHERHTTLNLSRSHQRFGKIKVHSVTQRPSSVINLYGWCCWVSVRGSNLCRGRSLVFHRLFSVCVPVPSCINIQ